MRKKRNVYLSLGSNIGDKYYYLTEAVKKLDEDNNIEILRHSQVYSSEPVGFIEQERFYNCAVHIKTSYTPYALLKKINTIESELRRIRDVRWGPRTIDIDIIFFGSLSIDRADLIIPHKEWKNRNFVIVPILEISGNRVRKMILSSFTRGKEDLFPIGSLEGS